MKNRGKIYVVVLCLLVLSIAFSGCAKKAEEIQSDEDKFILIGGLYPLSGSMADSGRTMQYGIDFAINRINANGGVNGYKLKVVWGDSQGDSAVGMVEAERLINEEKVDIIMGAYQSSVTLTASQIGEQYGVPFITANATSDALTANGYQYFFRLAPTNMMFMRDMVAFGRSYSDANDLDLKTMAICADNSEVGQQTIEWAKYFAEENDFTVVSTVTYSSGAADLTSEVLQLKDANADILIADQYVSDAILLTNTMAEQGYKPAIMVCKGNGYTESSYAKAIGNGANGISVATEFIEGSKGDEISDAFKEFSKESMNGHSAEAFTVVYVIAEAAKNILDSGGELTHDSIKDELIKISIKDKFFDGTEIIMPYNVIEFCDATTIGSYEYLHTNLAGKLTIGQFQNGNLVAVYPEDAAQAEVIYPATYK